MPSQGTLSHRCSAVANGQFHSVSHLTLKPLFKKTQKLTVLLSNVRPHSCPVHPEVEETQAPAPQTLVGSQPRQLPPRPLIQLPAAAPSQPLQGYISLHSHAFVPSLLARKFDIPTPGPNTNPPRAYCRISSYWVHLWVLQPKPLPPHSLPLS